MGCWKEHTWKEVDRKFDSSATAVFKIRLFEGSKDSREETYKGITKIYMKCEKCGDTIEKKEFGNFE
jgi:hypothetical protein